MVSILDGMGYTSQIPQPPSVSENQTRDILSADRVKKRCDVFGKMFSQLEDIITVM